MHINIHFFRKSNLEKLDYSKVLDYFETLPNFKTFVAEDYVEVLYSDNEFDFKYRYLITKQSRVNKIYDLDPMFSNVNILLEMPILIPSFLAKEILAITQKFCKIFDLDIYQDSYADVQAFNLVDVLVLFEKTRTNYIEEHGLKGKIVFDNEKLNIICKYQRSVDNLKDYYHNEVAVNFVEPIIDEINGISGISYTWNLGTASVFPPYIEYIYIVEESGEKFLVGRESFFKVLNKYFTEIKTFLPDLYVIKPKQARNTKKEVKKLKKSMIVNNNLKKIRLCDVLEK